VSDGELTLRMMRVLAAPRAIVWKALTDPGELARWWGPRGFSTPAVDFDAREGARYRIAMQPPEGERFHLSGEFREVEPPIRLAFTFNWEPPDPDDRETLATISLDEADAATTLGLTLGTFATGERLAVHEQGWGDSLDRLEELLAR
jgi:uncharacterized protein YndB with AHSA1/START domain